MGWFDGIKDIFTGGGIAGSLVRTVAMGYVLNKVTSSATKANNNGSTISSTGANSPGIDNGVRLQVPPAADQKIPVLYGTAFFGGIISEAVMSNNNQRMTYVVTLAEKTGTLLSNSAATGYTVKTVLWNDAQVYLKADGITIDYVIDRQGNKDESLRDLVKIYFYAGSSASANQKFPTGYSGTAVNAYDVVPTWNSSYAMNNLVFAVIEVNYSAERNVKGIGDVKVELASTMYKPGDVLYDFLTNGIYGANIANVEIDTTTLANLNTYSNSSVTYNGSTTLTNRYQINGLINTEQQVMATVEDIASSAGSWLSYSILTGKWGVIINKAGTSVASFDDSNILGGISVSGTGLSDLYNSVKTEFPNRDIRDTTDYVQISIPAGDRNANEQDNTLNISYNLVNEPVQAQLLGFIELKQSRIDLVITFQADYTTIGLNAGEIIDVTNSKLGFTNKLFRVISVAEVQGEEGLQSQITALEYDANVYNEDLTRYTRTISNGVTTSGNIGIPGKPTITKYETDARPRIEVSTTAPSGIVEGIEYWLSNDVGLGEAQRSYRLIATKVPTNGNANVRGTYTTGTTVTLDYDTIGTSNLVMKTRAYNSTTVGPFSSNSSITSFTSVQATDAILPTTMAYNDLGGLATTYGLIYLLNNLDGLFGNSATSVGGVFDKIKGILFPDAPAGETNAEAILTQSNTFQANINDSITSAISDPAFISNVSKFTSNLSAYSINELGDVDTVNVSPTTTSVLYWNGTKWVPGSLSGATVSAAPAQPGDPNYPGGENNPIPPSPSSLNLSIRSTLPVDYATWNSSTQEITWMAPNQAPTTGSYYVYFGGTYGNANSPIYGNLTIGSGNAKLYKSNGTLVQTVAAGSMSVDKNRLEIPFANREAGINYYILLDAGLVAYCGRTSPAISSPTTWNFNTPYYIVSPYSAPAGELATLVDPTTYSANLITTSWSHESNVCPNSNLVITYSEDVVPGTGVISVLERDGPYDYEGTLGYVANISASLGVNSGRTINYGPIPGVGYNKHYRIVVPDGAAQSNRPDYGVCSVYVSPDQISSQGNIKFFGTRTKLDYLSYALVSVDGNASVISDPMFGNVSMESDLQITFTKSFSLASGNPLNVSIYESDGTLHQTFNLKSSWNGSSDFTSEIVRISGTSIYFNPTKDFKPNTTYYATIAANVVTDGCSFNDAVTDPNTIRWTVLGNLALASSSPTQGSNNNTINDTGIEINFGQPISPGVGNISIYNSANVLIANISSTNGNVTYA